MRVTFRAAPVHGPGARQDARRFFRGSTSAVAVATEEVCMAGQDDRVEACADCGATIYPEHIEKHLADRLEGKLLCAHCLRDHRAAAPAAVGAPPAAAGIPFPVLEEAGDEGPVIEYDKKTTVIRAFGGASGGLREGAAAGEDGRFHRALLKNSPSATRCRAFHCKLADAALSHMCTQINEWADSDGDIEIKFATSCIGVVEGKHADPHLIVTVFY
jgi:hypothetical protein